MRRFMILVCLIGCGNSQDANVASTTRAAPTGTAAPTAIVDAGVAVAAVDAGSAVPSAPTLAIESHALPGVTAPASLDFIAYEPGRSRVWIPEGTTGSVLVFDIGTGKFTTIGGFKTVEAESHGQKRKRGPSAAVMGNGVAYVGNRGTSEVCPVDLTTLKPGKCLKLPSAPDALSYAPSAKELWVTTPGEQSVVVLDASKPASLKVKATIKVPGSPECSAIDESGGRYFTNLEDKDGTLAIDMKTHKIVATWSPKCGEQGPRGVVFDAAHHFAIVACTDHVQVLDAAHDGATLGTLDTGAGMDGIELANGNVYAAAGKAAKLTVAAVDDKGQLTTIATANTSNGARNAVVDAAGNAYLADAPAAQLDVAAAAAHH